VERARRSSRAGTQELPASLVHVAVSEVPQNHVASRWSGVTPTAGSRAHRTTPVEAPASHSEPAGFPSTPIEAANRGSSAHSAGRRAATICLQFGAIRGRHPVSTSASRNVVLDGFPFNLLGFFAPIIIDNWG
jgi:hypothetical protein